MIGSADRQIRRFGVQIVESDDAACGALNSILSCSPDQCSSVACSGSVSGMEMIWNADREIGRFGVSTVKVNDLEGRPSNSTIWSPDRPIQRFGMLTVEFNDLKCRPSNSTIWSADREI